MPTIAAEPLRSYVCQIFEATGVPFEAARITSDSLVDANLCGHDSHGVIRVPQYIQSIRAGQVAADATLTVLQETPAILAADANWGLGQVQAHRLMGHLIPKAQALGVAAGTLRRCGHTGRLGEYAESAAAKGLAFFGAVNNHGFGKRVAPPGGTEGRISTNPLCLGVPTKADPVVLDIGTSVCAEGKVRVTYQKGELMPPGMLLDSKGQPTTDPSVLYKEPAGTILPLGGLQAYKGFGLGLLLDMLAGGLSGGLCSRPVPPVGESRPGTNAVVFVLFNPQLFGGSEHFLQEVTDLAEAVRTVPRIEGVTEITLPGDPERREKAKRSVAGIAIPDATWQSIVTCGESLLVPSPVV